MDLRKAILQAHSRSQALKIAAYIGTKPDRFTSLVQVFLEGPYVVTQRSAWPLSIVIERNPDLLNPHLGTIIRLLSKAGIHNAVRRNTMRMLQFVDIPKHYHGRVISLCFDYLSDRKEAIAVRVFAMTVLTKLIGDKPGLINELRIMLEDELPVGSPGFRSRAQKVLKQFPHQ